MASTNHTSNYNLPQWEATDPFKREDFNDAFSKIDTAVKAAEGAGLKMLTGTYTGSGTANRTISIGVTPKVVMLWQYGYSQYDNNVLGGVALTGCPSAGVAITDGGFTVYKASGILTNTNTVSYYYIVLY